MPRDKRRALIAELQKARGSTVLCYVTGDRSPVAAQIGDDAIRPIYQLIREAGPCERLDFFLYSRGGAIDVPWRIVSALRGCAKEWNILIPFRANSAGTLIALGADQIVMGPQGELGPIDPTMALRRVVPGPGGQSALVQDQVSVEDVMAYVKFIQDKGGLSEQAAVAGALNKLVDRVDALTLGNVYRTHQHIRDVAKRILLSRAKPPSTDALESIVKTLAELVYAHGHAIGVQAAKEMGLPVHEAEKSVDDLMWKLFEAYETDLKLDLPIDPASAVAKTDLFSEDGVIAVVENAKTSYELCGQNEVRARRQLPQNLQVALNLSLQIPPGINAQQAAGLQQVFQQLLQELQKAVSQQAQQAVRDALNAQAPLLSAEAAFRDGRWKRFG